MDQVLFDRRFERGTAGIEPDVVVDAGVVDQAVQCAEFGQCRVDRTAALRLVGQFDLKKARTRLRTAQVAFERRRQRAAAKNQRDRAFRRQRLADRAADTGAAAGDDHDLVAQFEVHHGISAKAYTRRAFSPNTAARSSALSRCTAQVSISAYTRSYAAASRQTGQSEPNSRRCAPNTASASSR